MTMINIWSGCKDLNGLGAALTNPTELAKRKGILKGHYPVNFKGSIFADSEAAYKFYKTGILADDMAVMIEIIKAKLQQHPRLTAAIARHGGVEWLEACSHIVGVKRSRWEGTGKSSNFIVCLIKAYESL
ncbi:MAG: hypothetical protein ACRC6M_10835 [Microcystaceae cyanobacterium]